MTISFENIPNTLRVPFVAAEFDSTAANQGPGTLRYRALIIGQKTSGGSGTANTFHKVTNVAQVITLAGRGSMLHRQAIAWFKKNKSTEVWIGILADDDAGASAAGTITVTGPSTAAGTIALYVGGVLVNVAVPSGATADQIATAIGAAVDANLDLAVDASVTTNVATLTYRHKGAVGNAFDLRVNYNDGEALPAGVSLAIVQLTGGTTNPALTGLISALGDIWFNVIAHPYLDDTSLDAIEGELADRFGPMRMIDGVAFASGWGSHGTLTTLGDSRNSPHSVIIAQASASPLTPAAEFAAETAALAAIYAQIDPARPFQTLAMGHALPPAEVQWFTLQERNLLLFDGIATSKVGPGGVVQLDRLITTYQENSGGADDTAYLDATTPFTLMRLRYEWRNRILTKYPRHKLADDGFRGGPGQAVVTPKLMKAEALGWYRDMEELGLVENFDLFKANLVVERNGTDPNRIDVLLPPDLINQLMGVAAKIQFRL